VSAYSVALIAIISTRDRERLFEASDDFVVTGRLAEKCACRYQTLSDATGKPSRT
jgi:hypothetical protein